MFVSGIADHYKGQITPYQHFISETIPTTVGFVDAFQE